MHSISKSYKLKVCGILVLAAALRLPGFMHPHLGMESIHIMYVRMESLVSIVKSAAAFELSPFFFVTLASWSKVSVLKNWIVALPIILHLISILLLCRFGRKWGGETAGLTAGFLAAISPYMIHCSVSPRYENYIILFSLISVYSCFELLRGRGGRRMVAVYIISSICALYTYYYFIYILAFQNLYFLIRRRRIGVWIVSQAAIIAFFAPWLPFMMGLSHTKNMHSKSIFQALWSVFADKVYLNIIDIIAYYSAGMHFPLHQHSPLSRLVLITGLLIPAAAFCAAFVSRRAKPDVWKAAVYLTGMLAFCLSVAIFGLVWLALVLHPKHAVVFSSVYFLLMGITISVIKLRPMRVALLAAAVVSAAVSLCFYYPMMLAPNEFVETMNYVRDHEKPGDMILVAPAYYQSATRYYYSGRLRIKGFPMDHDLVKNEFGQDWPPERTIAAAKSVGELNSSRIWLLLPRGYTEDRIPGRESVEALEAAGYKQILKHGFISDVIPRYDGFMLLLEKK